MHGSVCNNNSPYPLKKLCISFYNIYTGWGPYKYVFQPDLLTCLKLKKLKKKKKKKNKLALERLTPFISYVGLTGMTFA